MRPDRGVNINRTTINSRDSNKRTNPNVTIIIEPQARDAFYRRYALFLEKISNALQSNKENSKVKIALNNIRNAQAVLGEEFSERSVITKNRQVVTNVILTPNDLFRPNLFPLNISLVENEMLWIAISSLGNIGTRDSDGNLYHPMDIGLVGIDLKNKNITSLYQATIFPPTNLRRLSGISITKNASYIFLQNVGILKFPGTDMQGTEYFIDTNSIPEEELPKMRLEKRIADRTTRRSVPEKTFLEIYQNNRKPELYTQENGLPSILITSMAKIENKFWIAYGDDNHESGLGIYDFNTEQWETIFCSTINDGKPFNGGKPYQINSMLYMRPDTLYMNVSGGSPSGLCKMNTMTRKVQYISSVEKEFSENKEHNSWLTGINLNYYREKGFMNDPIFAGLAKSNRGNFLDLSNSAIHDNKLWMVYEPGQIMIVEKDKKYDETQVIDNNILDGNPVKRFLSTPYGLVAIGDGIVGLIEVGD